MEGQIGHNIAVNGKEYHISCWGSEPRKITNSDTGMGVSLEIQIFDKTTGDLMSWKDAKQDVYLMEKISDFARNSFNGQNSFYWDWNKHKEDTVRDDVKMVISKEE